MWTTVIKLFIIEGTNNDYEVKLNSDLALAAQNDAVL
jgi:hypothetical protein